MKANQPLTTSVRLRSRKAIELLALCKKRRVSYSAFMDALLDEVAVDMLKKPNDVVVYLKGRFAWPFPRGLR